MAAANKTTPLPNDISRTSAGLRDAIFDEIDAIRKGDSNPTRANAVAKLAAGIVDTVRMDLEVQRFALTAAATTQAVEVSRPLPADLQLGMAGA